MAKQVLSVADFATILTMVDDRIYELEQRHKFCGFGDEMERVKRQKELDEMRKARLETPYYKNLIHLKESLQNLNIEVETPSVEVSDE